MSDSTSLVSKFNLNPAYIRLARFHVRNSLTIAGAAQLLKSLLILRLKLKIYPKFRANQSAQRRPFGVGNSPIPYIGIQADVVGEFQERKRQLIEHFSTRTTAERPTSVRYVTIFADMYDFVNASPRLTPIPLLCSIQMALLTVLSLTGMDGPELGILLFARDCCTESGFAEIAARKCGF